MAVTINGLPPNDEQKEDFKSAFDIPPDPFVKTDVFSPLDPSEGALTQPEFPLGRSPLDEITAIARAGQAPGRIVPTVLGQALLLPPTETLQDARAVRTTPMPWTDGNAMAMPLCTLRSFAMGSPVDLGLFRPTEVRIGNTLRFRFEGAVPLFTLLSGALDMFVWAHDSDTTVRRRIFLSLCAINGPSWEQGGANYRVDLARSMAHPGLDGITLTPTEADDVVVEGVELAIQGVWSEKTLHFCQEVVLYPGVEYYFRISVAAAGNPTPIAIPETGIRYRSGGIQMLFDASPYVQSIASRNFEQ